MFIRVHWNIPIKQTLAHQECPDFAGPCLRQIAANLQEFRVESAGMSQLESIGRLTELQAEEMAVRLLLDSNLSAHTRPHIEEILLIIRAQIERERKALAACAE
jgi:hypothetical protein